MIVVLIEILSYIVNCVSETQAKTAAFYLSKRKTIKYSFLRFTKKCLV